jgi:peroxiredoxin
MEPISVGQAAPTFRLPSAQGAEVGLDEFRDRKNVIVWFTKGMACPFCRSHMSQLARAYPEVQKRNTEILEVTVSPLGRGKLYAQKFTLPFPYLCDPDNRVRSQWGLGTRSHGPAYYVTTLIKGMTAPKPPNDWGDFAPPLAEMPSVLADDDMGFFIVDKEGRIRYSLAGSYGTGEGPRPIPSNDEILGELERCESRVA